MGPATTDHRYLRSALEFAVSLAAEGQKSKPPLTYPPALDKFIKMNRIPAAALPSLRRIVDQDEAFRTLVARGALPDQVDPIGRVWLERRPGWEAEFAGLVSEAAADEEIADAAKRLKRAERRRDAAERSATRIMAAKLVLEDEVVARDAVIEGLRSDVVKLNDSVEELRAELVDTRNDVRHARDREDAAVRKLDAAEAARADAQAARGTAESVRDDVLADRAALAAERSELARLAAAAQSLAEQLVDLASPPPSGRPKPARRKALPMPGGVMGDSEAGAEYLLKSGASVLIDGYNVAKLGWPKLDLAGQRVVLLDVTENLVRRYGCDITVVFDGADVVGATADGRQIVRVVFSPADVIADDVIRDEVRRLPATRQVVVITNDREIVTDVKAMGANTMSSDQYLALVH